MTMKITEKNPEAARGRERRVKPLGGDPDSVGRRRNDSQTFDRSNFRANVRRPLNFDEGFIYSILFPSRALFRTCDVTWNSDISVRQFGSCVAPLLLLHLSSSSENILRYRASPYEKLFPFSIARRGSSFQESEYLGGPLPGTQISLSLLICIAMPMPTP